MLVKQTIFYGLANFAHLKLLVREVVDVLGGGEPAYLLLMETAAAETLCGRYADAHPDKWGVGVMQHDQINLDDIQTHGEARHFKLIKAHWGIDMKKVELVDLADNPLLSVICARLSYKRIPAPIPADRCGRAMYWKDHYNRNGKGNIQAYLRRALKCLGEAPCI